MNNIYFFKNIPSLSYILRISKTRPEKILVFCDPKLKSHFQFWDTKKSLSFYFIPSGEKTKSVESLQNHLKKIISWTEGFQQREILFIVIGGGSLIDLVGFLASVYKRGVPFISLPSTLLSALDSAHGGKNALNFKGIKNMIGTYYFPQCVIIIKSLMNQLSYKQKKSAYGELLKIALIEGGTFYKKIKEDKRIVLEKYLKMGIHSKLKIVKKDPYEFKSERKKLNLGHTLGHILELTHSLPHGEAVLEGLLFSLEWSFHKKMITQKYFKEIKHLIPPLKKKKMSLLQLKKRLRKDKKYKKNKYIDFVFIKKPGNVCIQTVSESDFIEEARRQGLIKQ